jgi:uncharacterized protein HemX
MTKYLIAILLALSLALGAGFWVQHRRIESLQSSLELAKAERDTARLAHKLAEAAILNRDKQLQKLQRQQAQRQKDLDRVLKDNRDWADQPVPDGITDWLRQRHQADDAAAAPGAAAGLSAP